MNVPHPWKAPAVPSAIAPSRASTRYQGRLRSAGTTIRSLRNSPGDVRLGGDGPAGRGYCAQQTVCCPARATFCAAPGAAASQVTVLGLPPVYWYALWVAALETETQTSVEIAYGVFLQAVSV